MPRKHQELEDLGNVLSDRGYHLDLSRTKNRSGLWECRIRPHRFEGHDGDWPHGRDDTLDGAIAKAVKCLGNEEREAIAGLF